MNVSQNLASIALKTLICTSSSHGLSRGQLLERIQVLQLEVLHYVILQRSRIDSRLLPVHLPLVDLVKDLVRGLHQQSAVGSLTSRCKIALLCNRIFHISKI